MEESTLRKAGWALLLLVGSLPGPASAQIGEARIQAGMVRGLESGGLPLRPVGFAGIAFIKDRFSLGPEGALVPGSDRLAALGGTARLAVGAGHRSYVVAGAGWHFWTRPNFVNATLFSGSIGAGVVLRPGRPDLTLEIRLHDSLQRFAGPEAWRMITVALGGRLLWH